MSSGASLKAQNAWLIRAVLAIHALVFLYVALRPFALAEFAWPNVIENGKAVLVPASLSLAAIVFAKLILLGLIPSHLRDQLIHWRWKHPLPGSRAFSKFGPADPRVDLVRLADLYGPLPIDPNEQSRLFYRVYRQYAISIGVLDAHRSYLAARDIGTINLILFILLPVLGWWATGDELRTALYAATLLLAYFLTAIAAQIYSARLIENVLASASAGRNQI